MYCIYNRYYGSVSQFALSINFFVNISKPTFGELTPSFTNVFNMSLVLTVCVDVVKNYPGRPIECMSRGAD